MKTSGLLFILGVAGAVFFGCKSFPEEKFEYEMKIYQEDSITNRHQFLDDLENAKDVYYDSTSGRIYLVK